MANKTMYPDLKVYGFNGAVIVAGSFQLNSTSDPDILTGYGFTVTRVDVGKFKVTLSETFPGLISRWVSVGETADDANHNASFDEHDRSTSFSSCHIYVRNAATDADTDNKQVDFGFILQNSSRYATRSS